MVPSSRKEKKRYEIGIKGDERNKKNKGKEKIRQVVCHLEFIYYLCFLERFQTVSFPPFLVGAQLTGGKTTKQKYSRWGKRKTKLHAVSTKNQLRCFPACMNDVLEPCGKLIMVGICSFERSTFVAVVGVIRH